MASSKSGSVSAAKSKSKRKPGAEARSSTQKTPVRNAVALLKADHVRVGKLLGSLKRAKEASERQRLLKDIEVEIQTHSQIEEDIFYPAFKEAVRDSDAHLYFEALEEHHLVDIVLGELKSTDAKSGQFAAKAKVLKELIEHHVEEEETEMFPVAKSALGDTRLRELGRQMEQSRQEGSPGILTKVAVAAGSTLGRLMKRGTDSGA